MALCNPAGAKLHPMFEHFTDRAMKAMSLVQASARSRNHGFIGTEHMLLGLLVEPEALGARTLAALTISLDDVRTRVQEMLVAKGVVYTANPPLTPRMKQVFVLSLRESLDLGHDTSAQSTSSSGFFANERA
jgi:ATP-dependent Clp protease ATP-binding subunit ClpC